MNNKILKYEIWGFVFVCVAGTLGHFMYDLCRESAVIGAICPVNESPWEHMKLLFFPTLIYTAFEAYKLKQDKFNVFFAKYAGVALAIWTSLSIYYTANGVLGESVEAISIASFYIAAAAGAALSYALINSSIGRGIPNGVSVGLMLATAIMFVLFTFEPPLIPLFQDPTDLSYGI